MKKQTMLISAGIVAAGIIAGVLFLNRSADVTADTDPEPTVSVSAVPVDADDSAEDDNTQLSHSKSPAALSVLRAPSSLIALDDGSRLVTDLHNKVVWKLLPGGVTVLYAGSISDTDLSDTPVGGYNDGPFEEALFQTPWAIAAFVDGYAVSDQGNHVIRYLSEDTVYTLAGSGTAGLEDGIATNVSFNNPTGLAVDGDGVLYVADTGNHVIRRIDTDGKVETFAGSSPGYADGDLRTASFCEPTGLFWYDNALYVADSGNHCIRKIKSGQVTTIAGTIDETSEEERSSGNFADGPVESAMFFSPQGITVDSNGDIYVADTGNSAIRRIRDGQVETLLRTENGSPDLYPVSPRGLLLDEGTLYYTDIFAGLIFELVP